MEVAKECGVNAAIIYTNIAYWVEYNEANGLNCFDGDTWTYNSMHAYAEMFPYLTEKQVRLALSKLISADYIKVSHHSTDAFNRTNWYALTEKGRKAQNDNGYAQSGEELSPYGQNPLAQKGKTSIADINITDINTNISVAAKDNKKANRKKTKDPKKKYGEYENVLLSDAEYERLCNDYGQDKANKAIDYLDMYIQEKGYKSKDHNLAIRRWVIAAVDEKESRSKRVNNPGNRDYDWTAIQESLSESDWNYDG